MANYTIKVSNRSGALISDPTNAPVITSSAVSATSVKLIETGNGLTGGPITAIGTIEVLANTGIYANSSGLFANSTYISTLTVNSAIYLGTANLQNIQTFITSNADAAYTNAVAYVDGKAYVNTSQLSSNLANYQTSAGLSANVATLTANSSTFLDTANLQNIQTFITSNAGAAYSNAVAYVDGKSYVNTSQLSSNLANYQTSAGLSANVATLTSNNSSFAYGKTEINLNVNNALTANSSTFLGTANLQNIQTFITSNAGAAYSNAVSYVDGKAYVNTSQLSSNLANYQTSAGLAANVALLAANSAGFLGNSTGTIVNISSWIATNSATAYTNAVSYVDGKSYVNTSQLSSNLANYQTTVGLASNVAVLTSNNATFAYSKTQINLNVNNALTANSSTFLGTANLQNIQTFITTNASAAYTNAVSYVDGKSYVNTSQLSSNLANYALLTGATFSGNVRTQQSAQVDGNLVVSGNLTVTGNVVVIGANNLSVVDNMIYLNSNSVISNPDLGFAGNYNDGVYRHTGFFRDASDGVWKVFDSYLPEPDASPYIDTTNTSFKIANFQANIVYVGNTTVYSTINTTSFSGTANNTTNAFGKTEINLNVNNALTANSSTFLGTANLSNIQTFITSNAATAYTNAVAYVDGKAYVNTSQLSSNLANYQTTAGLASNVATLAANSATYANASISNTFTVGTSTYFIANGNVGVGTNAPESPLHIKSTGTIQLILEADSDNINEADNARIIMKQDGGAVVGRIGYANNTNDLEVINEWPSSLHLGTANTIRITADAGGNVGIGTTTPNATLAITGTANVSGNMTIGGSLTTTNVITVGTSTYFIANGNVGVGVSSTNFKLDVAGPIRSSNSKFANGMTGTNLMLRTNAVVGEVSALTFYSTFTTGADTAPRRSSDITSGYSAGAWGNEYLSFNVGYGGGSNDTANTTLEKVRITSGGNVGIGNTAPDATLAITGTANVSGNVTIGSTLTSANLIVSNLATVGSNVQIGTNGLVLGNSTVNSTYIAGILAFSRTVGANVGAIDISTTSTGIAYLELGGTTGAYIDFKVPFSDDYDQRIQANSSSIEIVGGSSTSAANNILLTAANVGIGTTTPDARLAVVGTANVSGNMTIGGSLTTSNVINVGTSTYFVSNGNVGIGTNAPNYKLAINGGILGSTLGSTVNAFSIYSSTGNADYINFSKVRQAVGSDWTTAAWRLQQVVDVTNHSYIQFNGAGLQQGISFGTANTERMRIDSSGNVGIGNTAPNATLAITGTANVSGNVAIGGTTIISGNTTLSGALQTISGNVNIDAGLLFVDSINNRVGIGNTAPNATLAITGTANVSGNAVIGGTLTIAGNVTPSVDNSLNLGSASFRWANIYTGDLQLSNEGSDGNDIDHTTGSWTIQEGHENLYLINRKTGKKYMFVLKEV